MASTCIRSMNRASISSLKSLIVKSSGPANRSQSPFTSSPSLTRRFRFTSRSRDFWRLVSWINNFALFFPKDVNKFKGFSGLRSNWDALMHLCSRSYQRWRRRGWRHLWAWHRGVLALSHRVYSHFVEKFWYLSLHFQKYSSNHDLLIRCFLIDSCKTDVMICSLPSIFISEVFRLLTSFLICLGVLLAEFKINFCMLFMLRLGINDYLVKFSNYVLMAFSSAYVCIGSWMDAT